MVRKRRPGNAGDKARLGEWAGKIQFLSGSLGEIGQPFAAVYPDGQLLTCNSSFCELTGFSHDELLSKSVSLMPLGIREDEATLLRALDNKTLRLDRDLIHKDGGIVPVELLVRQAADSSGKVLFYYSFVTPRSACRQAEDGIHCGDGMFRDLAESTSAAICILQDGRFKFVNPALVEISGRCKDELLSCDYLHLVHPGSYPKVIRNYREWLQGKKHEFKFEFEGISGTGGSGWIDMSARTIDYHGRPALLLTGIDITDRKRAEKALQESEERLKLCVAAARIGVFDWDLVNDRHVWSPETYEIYGLPFDAPLTIDYLMGRIYPGDRKDDVFNMAIGPAGTGEYSMEYRIIRGYDNAFRWISLQGRVFFSGEGPERKAIRILGVVQDITERKQAESAVNAAKAQAELYLDLMGHDLNNMLQIALGYMELGREVKQNGEPLEFLDKPIEVLHRSARLIKNVRKLQKLRDGELRLESMDLCKVLADIGAEFGSIPNKTLVLNLNGLKHCHVRANELLYDLFSNLVINAIKHTGHRVDIVVNLREVMEKGNSFYQVSVEDNGPGIPGPVKEKIFNRMQRGETKAMGSGLGLYLVKSLVDSYNGHVWVEDRMPGEQKQGTRVVVMLPAVEK